MPYADPTARRLFMRQYMRDYRARRKAEGEAEPERKPLPADLPYPDQVALWAGLTLTVPPGHPAAGEPMILPAYFLDFLRGAWGHQEAALSVGRKNAKTACLAVLCLASLVGADPLRAAGWRGAAASISRAKADELRRQVEAIAAASDLPVRVRRSPWPGRIESDTGVLEVLSADRDSGAASGYDLVVLDETGLLPERKRDYVAGLRSSVSARRGRMLHISVRGDSPIFREILENPAVYSVVHAAPDGCALDDESGWLAANPTLGAIKGRRYMASEVERVRNQPTDEASFRAFDLNQALSPTRAMIFSPDDLRACYVAELPDREGPCFLGFDMGGAASATAAVAIWPHTGRLESWMAFGDNPDLATRGRRDDADYVSMAARGELRVYPGRVTPADRFLSDLSEDLSGEDVRAASDSYKRADVEDASARAGVYWPWDWRRSGSGQQGSADVRSAQRLVLGHKFKLRESLSMAAAVAASELRHDPNGNPAIDKARSRGRIDLLSALVLASGLAESEFDRPTEFLMPRPVWG